MLLLRITVVQHSGIQPVVSPQTIAAHRDPFDECAIVSRPEVPGRRVRKADGSEATVATVAQEASKGRVPRPRKVVPVFWRTV